MDYFENKVDKLISDLPTTNTNPLKWLISAMERWTNKGKCPTFYFKEISLSDTIKLISTLNNSTSSGIDNIDSLAIKAATSHLAPPIRHLINSSLSTSQYANKWKLSKLLPLLKSSHLNKLLPSSYRPIAILPTISKLVEKSAQQQLLKFLEDQNLLSSSSHAYRRGYSTTTSLLEITDMLFNDVDDRKRSALMTIDQSAAFDCVQHEILIKKT